MEQVPTQGRLLVPGRNCMRIPHASRVAFLVDGAAYFAAFVSAVRKAERSILITGWDFDSRVALLRGEDAPPGEAVELGPFLNGVVSGKPELQAWLLAWDFAMIYALEREPLPIFKLGWKTHRRVHFRMDGEHPLGASHHQKLVVIDDKVAFCGGLDLTKVRWDTPEHRPNDPRRVDPAGEPYPPFHDVQMVVDGDAAAALGDVVRERWRRATGRVLERPPTQEGDPWPDGVEPDLTDVAVGVARTFPAFKGHSRIDEVERLYQDAIAGARHTIYIENQYFTSASVRRALAERLEEPDGPEVVIVLPRSTSGWLEEHTMDALRSRIIRRLREADRGGRFRVYEPIAPGGADGYIKVHAKVMVVDDTLVRVGSSNLSNRSMGLDTECDLAIESAGEVRTAEALRGFRDRLLAEHLGTTPDRIEETVAAEGSLIRAIERLSGGGRTLRPLEVQEPAWLPAVDEDEPIVDPERPVALDRMIDEIAYDEGEGENGGTDRRTWVVRAVLIVLALAALAGFWRFTPIGEAINQDTLAALADRIADQSTTPVYVLGAYLVGSVVMFPVTLLIGATAAVFEPWTALGYAFAGSLAGSLFTYWLGHLLGRGIVRNIAGGRLNRLSRRLAQSGLVAVMVVRVLPVAPFTVVNMVAGASHIKLKDYVLGTILGMTPGILAVTVFVDRLRAVFVDPAWENIALMVGVGGVALVLGIWLTRRLTRRFARQQALGAAVEGTSTNPDEPRRAS